MDSPEAGADCCPGHWIFQNLCVPNTYLLTWHPVLIPKPNWKLVELIFVHGKILQKHKGTMPIITFCSPFFFFFFQPWLHVFMNVFIFINLLKDAVLIGPSFIDWRLVMPEHPCVCCSLVNVQWWWCKCNCHTMLQYLGKNNWSWEVERGKLEWFGS